MFKSIAIWQVKYGKFPESLGASKCGLVAQFFDFLMINVHLPCIVTARSYGPLWMNPVLLTNSTGIGISLMRVR